MDRPTFARRISARALEDKAAAPRPFYRFEAKAKDDKDETPDELWLYDEIGFSWYDEGITAAGFAKELAGLKGKALTLRVNSPGGDVFDGLAIKNLLADHPARVTAKVDGLAASIASVIVQSADEIVMGENSQMMIHDASGVAVGNADDMMDMAALLDMISNNIADVYAKRAGGEPKDWRKVMKGEKWYTADEAVEAGLADRVHVRAQAEDGEDDKLKTCPDCKGKGCDECDGTGKCAASARALRVAAQWCRVLFPAHTEAAARFENAAAALPAIDGTDTPAGAHTGPLEDETTPTEDDGVTRPAVGATIDPPPPAPAAVGQPEGAPDTPPVAPSGDGTPEPAPVVALDVSAFRAAVQGAVRPPQVDIADWRTHFGNMPALPVRDHNAPVVLPELERKPEPVARDRTFADLLSAATHVAMTSQPATVDEQALRAQANAPVELEPLPASEPTPEAPRRVLADLIRGAINLTANDQPAPELTPQPGPELPALPPFRLNVKDVRRAVREARF